LEAAPRPFCRRERGGRTPTRSNRFSKRTSQSVRSTSQQANRVIAGSSVTRQPMARGNRGRRVRGMAAAVRGDAGGGGTIDEDDID
jgi:hypothetical protein